MTGTLVASLWRADRELYGNAAERTVRPMDSRLIPWLFAALWLLVGCSTPPSSEGVNDVVSSDTDTGVDTDVTPAEPVHVLLAHNASWTLASSDTDPFALRAEGVRCDEEAVLVEEIAMGIWYDINTDTCDHATVHQKTLVDLQPGDTLLVWIWHYAMEHEGGDFHARVALGEPEAVVWQTTLPVPADSGLVYEEVIVGEAWPSGTPIWFHLSNHGVNTWSLVELARIDHP